MGKFILKRFLEAIPVLFAVATITFFLVRVVPGGPFDEERDLPKSARAALNAYYGLDEPLLIQYRNYLGQLVQGNLGSSFISPANTVNDVIAQRLPVSLQLGGMALLVALLVGLTMGLLASVRPNCWSDFLPMGLAMVGICLPTFVLGPLLIQVFGLSLGWFDVAGWDDFSDRILPATTLGLFYAAFIARLTRASMLEVANLDYMRTARAKGIGGLSLHLKHGFRNALQPVVSYLGPALAGMASGSFVVETVFNIPGLGPYFVKSCLDKDYTMVLGLTLTYAALLIFLNLVVDIALVLLNPRQRFE